MHRRTGALSRAGRARGRRREGRGGREKVRKNGRDRALLAMDEPYHKIVCLNSLICLGCEKKYFHFFSNKTGILTVQFPFLRGRGGCRGLGLSSGCLLKRTTKGNHGNFMKYFIQTGPRAGAPQGGPPSVRKAEAASAGGGATRPSHPDALRGPDARSRDRRLSPQPGTRQEPAGLRYRAAGKATAQPAACARACPLPILPLAPAAVCSARQAAAI